MFAVKRFLKNWILPPSYLKTANHLKSFWEDMRRCCSNECKKNIKFKDIHKGQRCFIVCSGPSIKKQNLLPLKDEFTFFVSSGFLHPDYLKITPKIHCVPEILFDRNLTKDKYINWFREINDRTGSSELFFSANDMEFITSNQLFKGRSINYISYSNSWNYEQNKIYDIAKSIPPIQSIPILCIIIAMYMGFSRIYLLGTEHDSIKGEYKHFYKTTSMTQDCVIDGRVVSIYSELVSLVKLWKQYRILRKIAKLNNITIFNATEGGILDLFPRVKFEKLFKK